MFEHATSKYNLKEKLSHRMNMNGTPLNGWAWEDQVAHHMKHRNLEAVDILNEAINRREELRLQKKSQ